jgi:hypothetical protein
MFYFQKKHPKSHIEKIYYFPIAIIPICKVSTIDLRKSVYCHKKPGILTHIKCLLRSEYLHTRKNSDRKYAILKGYFVMFFTADTTHVRNYPKSVIITLTFGLPPPYKA